MYPVIGENKGRILSWREGRVSSQDHKTTKETDTRRNLQALRLHLDRVSVDLIQTRVFHFSSLIKTDSQFITLSCWALGSYIDRMAASKGVRLKCAYITSSCALRNSELDRKKGSFVGQHVCLPVSAKRCW